MKIIYKPPITNYQRVMYAAMRIMVASITNGMKMEDLYPATNTNKDFGIFCHTVNGGKMFWTYNELEDLYIRKNHESKRFRG